MTSDAPKKRKTKVLRSEGGTPEMKRGRGEGDQQVTSEHRKGSEETVKGDLMLHLTLSRAKGIKYREMAKLHIWHRYTKYPREL